MYKPKFGLSASYRMDSEPNEIISQLRKFNFTSVELNFKYIERHRPYVHEFAEVLECVTCHLPHSAGNQPLTADPMEDAAILDRQKRHMEFAVSVGCRTFAFHLGNVCGQTLDQYWRRSIDFARQLGRMASELGAVVGLENSLPVVGTAKVARRFLDEVAMDEIGLTLDTGHFWSILQEDEFGKYRENPRRCTDEGAQQLNALCNDMAGTVADKIVGIHIHNLRSSDWLDHQAVDRGVMDYTALFEILRASGYNRTITVELRPTGDWSAFESSAEYLRRFMA